MSLKTTLSVLACLIAGVLAAAMPARATTLVLNMPSTPVLGGVYTSPYPGTIDGVPSALICDDFTTEAPLNTPWSAHVTNLGALIGNPSLLSGVKFGAVTGALQDYEIIGVLAQELVALPSSSQQAQDLSYAIWGVFYPPALARDAGGAAYITDAAGKIQNPQVLAGLANVNIYTPDNVRFTQEYLTVTPLPEPGPLALMSAALLALALASRRWTLAARR